MSIEFADAEIPIAGKKCIAGGIGAEFYVFAHHRFAQINLKAAESDIPPIVYLDHMVLAAILEFFYNIMVFSIAGDINVRRAFHPQRFMRTLIVVAITLFIQYTLGIVDVFGRVVI